MGFLDKSGITDLATRLKKYFATKGYVSEAVDAKQDKLVSGTNIKTINNSSILGSGNINIQGGGVTSVNGQTGNVNLDYSDVGALSDDTQYVSTINGYAGDVNLDYSDVGALSDDTQYVSSIEGKTGYVNISKVHNQSLLQNFESIWLYSSYYFSLIHNNWQNNTITMTNPYIKSTSIIIVSPEPSDITQYMNAGIYCSAQAEGSITFTCSSVPSGNIEVNVIIYN